MLEADPLLVRPLFPSDALWVLERGRVHERLRNRDQAVAAYSYVAAVWLAADPAPQPIVQEARAALVRLVARFPRR